MNSAQREMGLLVDAQPISLASPEDLASCATHELALQRQLRHHRNVHMDYELAEKLGMSAATFSRIFGRKNTAQRRHLPGHIRPRLMTETGNAFLSQWELFQVGLSVTPVDSLRMENARLKSRLEAIEASLDRAAG